MAVYVYFPTDGLDSTAPPVAAPRLLGCVTCVCTCGTSRVRDLLSPVEVELTP